MISRPVRWVPLKASFLVALGLFLGWTLVFSVIELSPSVLDALPLQRIEYYALKGQYISDPDLVFVYRRTNFVGHATYRGDLFSSSYGVHVEPILYQASYDADGFRRSSSPPPYDVAVIGDSYIEFGENDASTFTELLKEESGLTVMNLGRGWYGPYQYLELVRKYALKVKPRFVILAFFAGNDFDDLLEYKAWKAGERYHFYKRIDHENVLSRFMMATGDGVRYLTAGVKSVLGAPPDAGTSRAPLGIIEIGENKLPMAFNYWERNIQDEEVAALREILSEFQSLCRKNDIIPILIYIPTAIQVYADLVAPESGREFIDKVRQMPNNPSRETVLSIANEVDVEALDLLPVFKSEAARGRLLYYTFDSHWTADGRAVAASFVAQHLRKDTAAAPRSGDDG
jgi:hypothetical protein